MFEKTLAPSSQRAHTKALDAASDDYLTRYEPEEQQPDALPWSDEFRNAVSSEFKCLPEAFVDLQLARIELCESANSGTRVQLRASILCAHGLFKALI